MKPVEKGKGGCETCTEKAATANGTRQHDSGARRQILSCERGYAGPKLRLRFRQSEINTNGNSRKKSFVWKQKHEGGIKFKPNEYYLYYVLNFRGRYEDINGRIYIRDELSV